MLEVLQKAVVVRDGKSLKSNCVVKDGGVNLKCMLVWILGGGMISQG